MPSTSGTGILPWQWKHLGSLFNWRINRNLHRVSIQRPGRSKCMVSQFNLQTPKLEHSMFNVDRSLGWNSSMEWWHHHCAENTRCQWIPCSKGTHMIMPSVCSAIMKSVWFPGLWWKRNTHSSKSLCSNSVHAQYSIFWSQRQSTTQKFWAARYPKSV